MIRRGHCILRQAGPTGEIRLVNQLVGLAVWETRSTEFVVPCPSYCNSAV
jgi:hypothetical protein